MPAVNIWFREDNPDDRWILEKLKELQKELGTSLSATVRYALKQYFKSRQV